jgi:predicted Zn-dependent peptidase
MPPYAARGLPAANHLALESGTDAMLNALFDPDDVEAEQTVILASSGPPP